MDYHTVVYIGHLTTTSRFSPYWEYQHGQLIEFRISSQKDIMDRGGEIRLRQATLNEYKTILDGIEQDS